MAQCGNEHQAIVDYMTAGYANVTQSLLCGGSNLGVIVYYWQQRQLVLLHVLQHIHNRRVLDGWV